MEDYAQSFNSEPSPSVLSAQLDCDPPVAVCQDITVQLDASGNASISALDVDGGSMADCGLQSLEVTPNSFDCSDITGNTYLVDESGTFGPLPGSGTIVPLGDDENSPALPIGFDFVFFGQTFSQFHISSNGLMGFNFPFPAPNIASTGCCLGQQLPDPEILNNLIAFAWEDLSPNLGGTIEYFTTGMAPNRILVVNVEIVQFFNGAGNVITQVQLHESSNHIEIHTTEITTGGVNQGLTVGVENADGTIGVAQPGFNRTTANGTIKTNDFVAFIPVTEVTLTVTDINNDVATCTAKVKVEDNIPPVALCQNITVELDANGNTAIAEADVDAGSNDACGLSSLMVNPSVFDCNAVGENTVTLSINDTSANTAACTATVTIEDNIPPIALCQNITIQLDALGMASISQNDIDNGSSDACLSDIVVAPTTFSCNDIDQNTVTLTVTDEGENSSSCTASVTVEDNVPPNALCQDLTLELDEAGMATISATDINDGSNDVCGIASLVPSVTNFDCSNTRETTYRVDESGTFNPIPGSGTIVPLGDDENSPALPIGFDFVFFGQTFSEFHISSNGLMGFNFPSPAPNIAATGCCLGQQLPDPEILNNLIAFAWEDLSPNLGGTIEYFTTGMAPNRILVVNVEIVQFFNGFGNVITQVQLHETSNHIEIHTTEITTDGVNQGLTVGVENADGTIGVAQPGFNRTTANGTIKTNDFVAFIPVTEVTLTVTDNNGNMASCVANITINDPPTALCQDITVQLDEMGNASITSADIDAGSSDVCGAVSLSLSQTSFSCPDAGPNVVTLTVIDDDGELATCTATVTVEDNILPVAMCQGATVQLNSTGIATVSVADIENGSSDVCLAELSLDQSSFSCPDVGDNLIVLTATDTDGNTATCTATVTVENNLGPLAICQDITVQLDNTGMGSITAADVDAGSCGVSTMIDVSSFDCNNTNGTTYRVDESGTFNPIPGSGTIVPLGDDENSPALPIGFDFVFFGQTFSEFHISSNGLMGFNFPSPAPNIAATGCCLGQQLPDPEILNNLIAFAWEDLSPNLGGTIEYFTTGMAPNRILVVNVEIVQFFNGAGNVITQVQLHETSNHIEIHTTEITTGGVNQGLTVGVENANGTVGVAQPGFNRTTANGTIKSNDFVAFFPGNPVILTVTDEGGNTATCAASVTVEDNIPPSALCQDITVELDANGNASINATDIHVSSSDACGVASMMLNTTDFACSEIGPNNVILSVVDANQNVGTCSATVTVEDNIPPVALCQDITIQLDATGNATIVIADIENGSSDACLMDLVVAPTSFSCAEVGANTVTLTATDSSGNTSTCTATVSVEDNVPPIALCQDITIELDASGNASISGADIDGGSNDACGIASLIPDITDFNCDDVGGINNGTYRVDESGAFNPIPGSGTIVNLNDDENSPALPIGFDFVFFGQTFSTFHISSNGLMGFNFPVPAANLDETGCCLGQQLPNPEILNNLIAFAWEDLSPNLGGTIEYFTTGMAPNRILVVNVEIVQFFNGAGNVITQVQLHETSNHIEIHTTEITTGGVNQGLTVGVENADGTIGVAQPGFNRTLANGTIKSNDFVAFFPSNPVVLTVTDENGNTASCVAEVEVVEIAAPTALCQDITIQLDATGNTSITAADIDNGSSSSCSSVSLNVDNDAFDCMDTGPNVVTLTATDDNGNSSTCTATVTVEDDLLPIALCQDLTIQLDATGNASIGEVQINNGSSDNCSISVVALDIASFDCSDTGANTVQLSVTDASNNVSTCSAQVTVEDNLPPSAICQNVTINLDANGNGSLSPEEVDDGSADVCGAVGLSLSQNVFTCADIGTNIITLIVADNNGNTNTCVATATVVDALPPDLVCLNATIILPASGIYVLTENDVLDMMASEDNCGAFIVTGISPAQLTCDDVGNTVAVEVSAADMEGNSTSCTAFVTVDEGMALPPPWQNTDVGAASGNASFQGCEGTFTVSSSNFPLPTNDVQHFVYQQICGNVEIIANVVSIQNPGWAGIEIRETLAPGARKASLKTQLTSFVRRAVRSSPGGQVQQQQLFRPGHSWLRLVRNGSFFIGYTSNNGANWSFAFQAFLPFGSCAYVGLFTESINASTTTTGIFDQVTIMGGNPIAPLVSSDLVDTPNWLDNKGHLLEVYPNPFSSTTNIRLELAEAGETLLDIFDLQGHLVKQLKKGWLDQGIHYYEWEGLHDTGQPLPPGMYLIRLQTENGILTQKVTLIRE